MGLFSKKLSDEELIQKNIAAQQAEVESKNASNKKSDDSLGDTKLAVEVTKVKAQLEGLNEQRKATNERFSHISEEIGELRGMIVETNKGVTRIEAASTKAIDMVESVKPDQLMIEVRKQDSKLEALKANIESNETMMKDMMTEMKQMRRKMDFYKGVEQVAKMNDEIKKELIDIKKTEGTIERHSSKVESIFLDVEKRYTELDKFLSVTRDLKRSFDKLQTDVDKLRIKTEEGADKKDLVKLIGKFNEFEKHTTNIINLLEGKTKSISSDMTKEFRKLQDKNNRELSRVLKKLNMEIEKSYDVPVISDESKVEEKTGFSFKNFFGSKKESTGNKKEENSENKEDAEKK